MNYIQTEIDGVWIIEPKVFTDPRGYFMESFKKAEFEENIGKVDFVQDNESKSSFGVLRGLHYQKGEYSQAKLVRVIKGKVLDVAVDLRKSSPNIAEAIEALDYVRDRRYKNQNYTAAPTDPDALLTEILNERRREIVFTEMSFLDHKRQNADPKTARPMERTVWGETYTMPVDDPRWQLPIPLNVMQYNPTWEQNER